VAGLGTFNFEAAVDANTGELKGRMFLPTGDFEMQVEARPVR